MGNNGPAGDVEEREHFQRIVNAFRYYRFAAFNITSAASLFCFLLIQYCFRCRKFSLDRIASTEKYVDTLPDHHQKLLIKYKAHLDDVKTCVDHNYEIIKLITADVATLFENVKHDPNQVYKFQSILVLFMF